MEHRYVKFMQGHVLDRLTDIPDQYIQCCLTSPPYFGLRNYGTDPIKWDVMRYRPIAGLDYVKVKQQTASLGNERDIWSYVGHLIMIFREVHRVLRNDGTLWVNLGDGYHGGGYANHQINGEEWKEQHGGDQRQNRQAKLIKDNPDMVPKNLWVMPWRFALAMQADGWILRNDIIWAKSVSFNSVYSGQCMPESVTDRTTKAHEYIFCFAKQPKYYYDGYAVRDKSVHGGDIVVASPTTSKFGDGEKAKKGYDTHVVGVRYVAAERNLRSVWTINPKPFAEAHFAVWPDTIADAIIRLSTSEKGCCAECGAPLERKLERTKNPKRNIEDDRRNRADCAARTGRTDGKTTSPTHGVIDEVKTVGWKRSCDCNTNKTKPCVLLDPFGGAGTTALAAARLRRRCISIELNPEYIKMAKRRIERDIKANASIWDLK